jgi:tetratricopeptide (TPR) repeat protein
MRQIGVRILLAVALIAFLLASAVPAQEPTPRQLFQEALEAQQHGNNALAVREYQELLRRDPEVIAARANLAGVLVSLGRLDEAIGQYRLALKAVPGNPQLELNLALAYFKKGDAASAARLFGPLHEAAPTNLRVAILLGECDLRLGREAQTVALLEPLEAANLNNLDLEWALGSALIATGHPAEGVKRVQMVAEGGRSAEAYMLAAETYLKLDHFDRARRDVDRAMRLQPDLPGLDTVDGTVLDDFGDPKGAEAAFEKAIKSDPNDFKAEVGLGGVLYSQRQLAAAMQHLDRALALQPSSPLAQYERGRVERAEGHLNAAVKDLELAERENPDWLAPHVELAALYYRVHRPADGARERKIVDQLTAARQQRAAKSRVITPGISGP